MRRLFLAALFLAIPSQAFAQTVTTIPTQPAINTPVTIVVTHSMCPAYLSIVRNGFVFDIEAEASICVLTPPVVDQFPVGLLPPGVYTVREFDEGDPSSARVIGSFNVDATAVSFVPALDPKALMLLAAALAGIVWFRMRGQ